MWRTLPLLTCTFPLLVLAPAARAGELIDRAAEALRSAPVYVDPDARPTVSSEEVGRLGRQISDSGAGPMYIAVLPGDALGEAGGDPNEVVAMLANKLRRDGTYAAVTGGRFRAGSTLLERGEAARMATEAFRASSGRGLAATLEAFVGRVGAVRSGGSPDDGSGTPTGGLVLLGIVAAGGGLFALSASRRRRRERDEQGAELGGAAATSPA